MAAQMIYLTDVPEIQGDTTWEDDFYTDFCIAVRYLNLRTGICFIFEMAASTCRVY